MSKPNRIKCPACGVLFSPRNATDSFCPADSLSLSSVFVLRLVPKAGQVEAPLYFRGGKDLQPTANLAEAALFSGINTARGVARFLSRSGQEFCAVDLEENRVRQLQGQGMTRADAQAVYAAEIAEAFQRNAVRS